MPVSTTTSATGYACPATTHDGYRPSLCGLPTRVYSSDQRPLGRYRRRICEAGHRCTTIERVIGGGVDDVGKVIEQAAWSVDTLRQLMNDAQRLTGGPLPPRYPSTRRSTRIAAQNAAQEA